MKEGLLWFDNDPQRKLADKISRAATRYQVKFGRKPTLCYLNASNVEGKTDEINGIRIKLVDDILPNHFWIGVETESVLAKAA